MRLSKLQHMDPIAFESFVGQLFREMGYRVEDTRASADEGIDLIVRRGRRMAVVQCKRYRGSVGQPVVRDLYGVMLHTGADEAYLVTTGSITRAARRWAEDKPIHLVDGHRLVEWTRTRRLNYDKPAALAGRNRPMRLLLGLVALTLLALYAVAPEQILRLRNSLVGSLQPAPTVHAGPPAAPTATPLPETPTATPATRTVTPESPTATATFWVRKPTPPGGGGLRPGPTVVLETLTPSKPQRD